MQNDDVTPTPDEPDIFDMIELAVDLAWNRFRCDLPGFLLRVMVTK